MGLASGLFFGLFLVWMRRLRAADPLAITGWNNLGVAAVFAVLLLASGQAAPFALAPNALQGDGAAARTLGLLALMGVVQIAVPYVLFSFSLRRVRSVEAGLLTLVEPVCNPIWVAWLIGEQPSVATLAGGGLIIAALALRYTLFAPRRDRAA
jgi:drug/metabolite transporter (DMT)-like permease